MASPWWDRAWLGTVLIAVGNLLVLTGVAVAWSIYRRQRGDSRRQRKESTLAHLSGVKAALADWHDNFFMTGYEGAAATARAQLDYNHVKAGGYIQNYRVPTEPVASLIRPAEELWPVEPTTIQAANVALSRMTVFNQLVQQQTDFNLRHSVELRRLTEDEREPIAQAAMRISSDLHGGAIGDSTWYMNLKKSLEDNIGTLQGELGSTPEKEEEQEKAASEQAKVPESENVERASAGPSDPSGLKAIGVAVQRNPLLAGGYLFLIVLFWILWGVLHSAGLLYAAIGLIAIVPLLAVLALVGAILAIILDKIFGELKEGTRATRRWGLLGAILGFAGLVVALIGVFLAMPTSEAPLSGGNTCTVSHCSHIVSVPDVIGTTATNATAILHKNHFSKVVMLHFPTTSEPNNSVFGEYPSSYTSSDSPITIDVWKSVSSE